MLAISSKDIDSIATRKEIADAIEQAMLTFEQGNYIMPDRMHVHKEDNTLLLMPCIANGVISTKLVNVFPNNSKIGLPSLLGTLILNDASTGEPIALMDGAVITALRTGAVGGVGVRYLAPKNAKSLLLIGTGVQGRNLVLSASLERNLQRVYAFDINFEQAGKFAKNLSNELCNVEVIPLKSVDEGLKDSEIVITATTSAKPVLTSDISLLKNKCFIGVGSYRPNTRELPEELIIFADSVFVDTPFAMQECGDIAIPLSKNQITKDKVKTLGSIINKTHQNIGSTTVFKTVGMALFDLFAAQLIYQKATERGVGTHLKL